MDTITKAGPGAGHLAISGRHQDIWHEYERGLDTSERTRSSYLKALRRYRAYLADNGITWDEATRETIVEYKRAIAVNLTANTVNAYLAAVRSFYSWLESERIYPNVAASVHGLKTSRKSARQSLTIDQARRLLLPQGQGLKAKRDRAIVTLMLTRGLRCVEVTRADIGDVSSNGGKCVLYVQGKGRADRSEYVILDGLAEQALSAYLAERHAKDQGAPLFAGIGNRNLSGRMTTQSVSRIVKTALRRAGIDSERITAHSLRHTAVTFSLLGGATVQEAQALARHADISTTMIYAHNLDRMEAKAERAIDGLIGIV